MNSSAPVRPLRILVDLSHLHPGGANGGVKPFLFDLLGWLSRQPRVPLRFIYLTRSDSHAEVRDELARPGDELICVRADTAPAPRATTAGPREQACLPPPTDLAWQVAADLVYSPFGPPDFAAPGIPALCLVVDLLHRDFPHSLPAGEITHREAYFARLIERADAIQCISQHAAARLREVYAVPPERVFVTYIAGQHRFESRPAAAPESGRAPYFLFPANTWPHKNHEALLLAYGIYRARSRAAGRTPWRLALTGHEDARWTALRELAATLGLAGEIDFHGFVSTDRLAVLWAGAGALVFPSLHEGFGMPLLEAMAHDVPVIASSATCLPEVGGEACLFVDARRPQALADALERVADDESLRAGLVARGRRRLEDFSLATEAGLLLERIVQLTRGANWKPFAVGVHPDGWTEEIARVGLPPRTGRAVLEVECGAISHSRRLLLRAGHAHFGGFDLPAEQAARLEIPLELTGSDPLELQVSDAASLAPGSDPRRHGIQLAAVRLRRSGDGSVIPLFPVP